MFQCCTAGNCATLACHMNTFPCSINEGFLVEDLCREFIAEDHMYYLNVQK